jgi:hypothetical protein
MIANDILTNYAMLCNAKTVLIKAAFKSDSHLLDKASRMQWANLDDSFGRFSRIQINLDKIL